MPFLAAKPTRSSSGGADLLSRHARALGLAAIGAFMVAWSAAAVALFPRFGGWHVQDLTRYRESAQNLLHGALPYGGFAFEYPPLALVPMALPALTAGEGAPAGRYAFSLLVWNALWGFALLCCVWRMSRRNGTPHQAARDTACAGALLLVGCTVFPWRFDLFPALLTAWALMLVVEARPGWAGGVLGLAIAAKLYPVVFAPVVLARYVADRDWRSVRVFAGAAFGAALATTLPFILAAGAEGFSFIRYHQLRGIQVESVAAGIIMLGHLAGGVRAEVVQNFGAMHLAFAGDRTVERFILALSVTVLTLVSALAYRAFRSTRDAAPAARDATLFGFALVTLLAFLLTNKVLSPQYLAWMIALVPFVPGFALALLASVLTDVVFLISYDQLVRLEAPGVLLLNARNVVLVALLVHALRRLVGTRLASAARG